MVSRDKEPFDAETQAAVEAQRALDSLDRELASALDAIRDAEREVAQRKDFADQVRRKVEEARGNVARTRAALSRAILEHVQSEAAR